MPHSPNKNRRPQPDEDVEAASARHHAGGTDTDPFTRKQKRDQDPRGKAVTHGLSVARAELRGESSVETMGTFRDYIHRRNTTLLDYEHVPLLADIGERIVQGDLRHVMVIMPPRYFKSEVFSRLLTGYFLRQRPDLNSAIVSYGAELAWDLSAEARSYYQADGGNLRMDTSAKKHWKTEEGGELWAAGVGGPLLGRGFNCGIVDDPTDPEKAISPAYQRRFREWWPNKFLSRRQPRAGIVLVMQRLGMDDPIDWLMRREVGEDTYKAPMNWHVVFMDEVKSNEPIGRWGGPRGLPPTCTLEPDPREEGEVIAPSLFDKKEVEHKHRIVGPYMRATQLQGRPMEPKGEFWKKDWFIHKYQDLPEDAFDGGWDWDTAYTKDEAKSATAGVRSYRGPGGDLEFPIYIQDVDWFWEEFPQMVDMIHGRAGPHYVEAKATGKSVAQALQRSGVPVSEVNVDGDKRARAAAVQPVAGAGRVYVHEDIYDILLNGDRQGLLRVTEERLAMAGTDLDLNDAFVQALHRHTAAYRRRQRVRGARLGSVTQAATPGVTSGGAAKQPAKQSGERTSRIRIGFTG